MNFIEKNIMISPRRTHSDMKAFKKEELLSVLYLNMDPTYKASSLKMGIIRQSDLIPVKKKGQKTVLPFFLKKSQHGTPILLATAPDN